MRRQLLITCCFLALLGTGSHAHADHTTHSVCRELVHLLINFNGRASPSERNTMANIINSSRASAQEKHIANIMLTMKNSPSPDERQTLLTISTDQDQELLLRELARILVKLDRRLSDHERRYLKSLLRRQNQQHSAQRVQQIIDEANAHN